MGLNRIHFSEKRTAKSSTAQADENNPLDELERAIRTIENSFGKGTVMKLDSTSDRSSVEVISTGSLGLDIALGIGEVLHTIQANPLPGGVPRGRMVEIYGPGKSLFPWFNLQRALARPPWLCTLLLRHSNWEGSALSSMLNMLWILFGFQEKKKRFELIVNQGKNAGCQDK